MNGSNVIWGRTGSEVIRYHEILTSTTETISLKKFYLVVSI